jgi:hypothetical protein
MRWDTALTAVSGDTLKGAVTEQVQAEVRCYMFRAMGQRSGFAVGVVSDDTWTVRLDRTVDESEDVRSGERIKLQRDGWAEYREFEIVDARWHGWHWQLLVKGTGS